MNVVRAALTVIVGSLHVTAYGGLELCNLSNSQVWVAVMYGTGNGQWQSQGWWGINPSRCATIMGSLNNRYYYAHAYRADGTTWGSSTSGCVDPNSAFTLDSTNECSQEGAEQRRFFRIDTGQSQNARQDLIVPGETTDFTASENITKACSTLYQRISKPSLRSQKVKIASYTDVLTIPQTKTECTNVYDTGVPDLSTCTTSYDPCASEWHGLFGTWGCIPGTTTSCSNIKACNTWASYKKTMECDLNVQFKLPNFVEKPVSNFLDNSFNVIEDVQGNLPLMCAPAEVSNSATADVGESVANAVAKELQRRVRVAVEREAQRWLQETAVTTIAAAIPSGGIGGAAAMATQLATFVHRTYRAVEPIVRYANEAKDFAEDLGFSTSCGWSDWHRF